MNFMAGVVQAAGPGGASIALAAGDALVEVALAEPPLVGSKVTVGMRPEHIAADGTKGVPATLFAVERLGEGTYLYASVKGSGEQVVVRADPDREWEIGQTLSLSAPQARIHVFGADGRRLRR